MDAFLSSENNAVQRLLTHITIKYLARLYCICIVWNSMDINEIIDIDFQMTNMEQNYPNWIQLKYEAFSENQTNIDDLVRLGIDNGCQAFIASPNAVNDFLNAYENIRYMADMRYHLIHVVALPVNSTVARRYIDGILNHPTVRDIPNILIISPSTRQQNNETFDLITSRFVTRNNGNDSLYLDTFYGGNGKFANDAILFPNKFTNLEGRIMRVALFNYKPYTIWNEVPAGLGNANAIGSSEEKTLLIDGTESLVIDAFCKLYNCTLAVSLDEAGEWGTIADNMTGDGVLGAIVERRADIGISALYSWHHEYQFLDLSAAMTRSGVTCICPKPSLLSGWFLPLEPFSTQMWITESVTFVSVFLAITITKLCRGNARTQQNLDVGSNFLQTLAMFMLQSTKIVANYLPEVIIGVVTLLMSQLIANAYSGGLASIMTVPQYESPIDSGTELADRNIEWGATHDAWIFSILDATPPYLIKLVKSFQAIPFEKLYARTKTRDFCFSVERLPYGHYAVGDYIDEASLNYLRLMHYDIYFEYCVAMFYKTWPFKSVFDLLVLNIVESGIQKYWELMTVAEHDNSKIQLGISISRDRVNSGPVRLSLDHVSGTFALLIIGLAISTIVFILEFVWFQFKKWKKRQNRSQHNMNVKWVYPSLVE